MEKNEKAIAEVCGLLEKSRRVVVLTGAGVSAESGIPTFRDAQTGLWARYRAEDLATAEAFRRDPKTVWSWYAWRRSLVASVKPNRGHYAIAQLETRVPEFTLVTQNVDGLHRVGGSKNVVEIHGNILRVRCFENCVSYTVGDSSKEARSVFLGRSGWCRGSSGQPYSGGPPVSRLWGLPASRCGLVWGESLGSGH